MAETPHLAKIAAGLALDCSYDIRAALGEIIPQAEEWVGRDFILECDEHGWSLTYTHGNSYRDRLLARYGYRFDCAEDAIASLAEMIARNKAEVEAAEVSHE